MYPGMIGAQRAMSGGGGKGLRAEAQQRATRPERPSRPSGQPRPLRGGLEESGLELGGDGRLRPRTHPEDTVSKLFGLGAKTGAKSGGGAGASMGTMGGSAAKSGANAKAARSGAEAQARAGMGSSRRQADTGRLADTIAAERRYGR